MSTWHYVCKYGTFRQLLARSILHHAKDFGSVGTALYFLSCTLDQIRKRARTSFQSCHKWSTLSYIQNRAWTRLVQARTPSVIASPVQRYIGSTFRIRIAVFNHMAVPLTLTREIMAGRMFDQSNIAPTSHDFSSHDVSHKTSIMLNLKTWLDEPKPDHRVYIVQRHRLGMIICTPLCYLQPYPIAPSAIPTDRSYISFKLAHFKFTIATSGPAQLDSAQPSSITTLQLAPRWPLTKCKPTDGLLFLSAL